MVGNRVVNDCSNPNWPARKCTNIGGAKPFIIEILFKLPFEPPNMIAAGNKVSKEKYVRTYFSFETCEPIQLLLGVSHVGMTYVEVTHCKGT